MTTVRHAEPSDMARIVEMGVTFVDSSSTFKALGPADPARIAALTRTLSTYADGCVFVAEVDGRVVGMLAGHIPVHPMLDVVMASELAWWFEPDHRGTAGARLLSAFAAWARERGANALHMVAPNVRVAMHYKRLGYFEMETSFMRRID